MRKSRSWAVLDSRRSNTATYTDILDSVRRACAEANAVDAVLFSASSKGACPDCNGLGVIYTDLAHLDPMVTTCETCDGRAVPARSAGTSAAQQIHQPRLWR
jgi:excinuclease UvrABC ATPase subunit